MGQSDFLKRYDIVMRYLGTEAQIFWTRSQLFLVAHAALVGLIFREIPISLKTTSATKLAVLFVGTLIGILLCGLWFRAIRAGNKWLDHWITLLETWEQGAMGDNNLLRKKPIGPSSRGVAKLTAWLFLVVWIGLAAFTAVCFLLKVQGIEFA